VGIAPKSVEVSTGGGAFASGSALKDMALGAIAIAEHVRRAAERYSIYVALHTDQCLKDKLDKFVVPLVEETERRRAAGQPNLFTGHMFDGSNLALPENLEISAKLLERFTKNDLVLEIETGAVGAKKTMSSVTSPPSSTRRPRTRWKWRAASIRLVADTCSRPRSATFTASISPVM
jgi:fructose/tagatose bisphosphate aldolase